MSAPEPTHAADVVPVIGKTVHQKLEELRQIDARIEKRLDHLQRAEQNLRLLFDSLRSQVLQAHPLIAQLNQLRQGSAELIDGLADQVRARIDPVMPTDSPPTVSLAIDTSAAEEQVRAAAAQAMTEVDARARQADEDLRGTIESARNFMDHAFSVSREQAEAALAEAQARLEELRAATNEARALREQQASPLALVRASVDGELERVTSSFAEHADATLDAVRRSMAQQVEHLAQQARIEIRPLLARIDEQKRSAEAQLAAAAESAESTLAARADELKRSAERMIELMERQISDRLATLRPRTRATLESVEQAAAERLTQAMDELTSSVVRTEQRLLERLESLRPRAAEVARQIERDMQEQVKRLEDDAVAAVHWLEHRLSRRVDDLTSRLGKTLSGQIELADERIDQADASGVSSTRPARPKSPVQVQVMVDALSRDSESNDPAAAA